MNFLKNPFTWHIITSITAGILTGCYIYEDKPLLALCWCIIAASNIVLTYFDTQGED